MDSLFKSGENADAWIPVDVSFIKEFWLPDAEILNLKEFKTLDVLSKLEGLWLNRNFEIMVIWVVKLKIVFECWILALSDLSGKCLLESVQDFLIKLDIKPLMHLLEISTFSLNT